MRFGRVLATHSGSTTLVDVTGPWPLSANLTSQPRRFVSRLVVDPTNVNVAYVTFATYCTAGGVPAPSCAQVYKTSNLVTAPPPPPFPPGPRPTRHSRRAGERLRGGPARSEPAVRGDRHRRLPLGRRRSQLAPYGTRLPARDRLRHGPACAHGHPARGHPRPRHLGDRGRHRNARLQPLASPTIGFGGGPTLLSGVIKAGSLVPPGSVDITVNGVTQSAPITGGHRLLRHLVRHQRPGRGRLSDRLRLRRSLGLQPRLGGGNVTVNALLSPTTVAWTPPHHLPERRRDGDGHVFRGNPDRRRDPASGRRAAVTQALAAGATAFAVPTATVGAHDLLATFAAQGTFGGSSATSTLTIAKGTPAFAVATRTIALGQSPERALRHPPVGQRRPPAASTSPWTASPRPCRSARRTDPSPPPSPRARWPRGPTRSTSPMPGMRTSRPRAAARPWW